mmetsp:Transcript_24830/g.33244  ORF Transcript_24830/g.33244 Transcript_24830/m.33244 type:complete len:265 (-) Transcript_24830:582-1376(-)
MSETAYYDLAYTYDFLTIAIPFVIALAVFYPTYLGMFRRSHHRIRSKRLVAKQTRMLKVLSFLLFLCSVCLMVAYGEFGHDFLIISLIMATLSFTFYAYLHWLIRWICVILHIFLVIIVETTYLRELILQLACYQLGKCRGQSSFNQMAVLETLKLSSGSILVEGKITFPWMCIMFWRTFISIILHYLCILTIMSLSLKLGIVSNKMVELQIEEILERPAEDSATMFSFVKQQFYHKSLAYTKYEKAKQKGKKKDEQPKRRFCC